MNREQLQELACLHALGALTPEEARAFEEQLRRDPELQALYKDLQNVTDAMVLNLEGAAPSRQLKERILAATAGSPKIVPLRQPREERRSSVAWLPWALAACLAVLAGGLFIRNASLQKRLTDLTAVQGKSEQQIAMLQTALDDLRARHRVTEIQVAVLDSLLQTPSKAMAVSVWDKDAKEGSLFVKNLAPLPSDKVYQAWVIDPITKKPVDAGVFTVDQQGGVRFFFRPKGSVGTVSTIAVSEEAAGGSTTEKGPTRVVLMGNLQSSSRPFR